MSDINSFLNGFIDIILRMSIYDLVDILIVAYIFYKIFMFIKDTRIFPKRREAQMLVFKQSS